MHTVPGFHSPLTTNLSGPEKYKGFLDGNNIDTLGYTALMANQNAPGRHHNGYTDHSRSDYNARA